MKTIIVWYRNDLRVHDHPALSAAASEADHVIPVFIFSKPLLHGRHGGSNRNRFLLESLEDLKASLKKRGADLIVRTGDAAHELTELAKSTNAEAVYYTADYGPHAIKRDKAVKAALKNIEVRSFPGRLIVSAVEKIETQAGTPQRVFTPFYKRWQQIGRRDIATTPSTLSLPSGLAIGTLPNLDSLTDVGDLAGNALPGGETAGRKRLHAFLNDGIKQYHEMNNDMAADATSRLSSYLHFGCLSPREIETMLPSGKGADAWHRQLCWRDFYHYVLLKFPSNNKQEFQEKYRSLRWSDDKKLLKAWQTGQTGYPVVDAAMRQLNSEGWMHNRARLIVGSFLTKDLWLDWRHGEAYFMRMLTDGDEANNNGNWQWIASVGVDPAPVFRRLYNPASQQKNYDPTGAYVRRYVPEMKNVPDKYLGQPWTMPDDMQKEAGCIIGQDYPRPIVDHAEARLHALEQFRSV